MGQNFSQQPINVLDHSYGPNESNVQLAAQHIEEGATDQPNEVSAQNHGPVHQSHESTARGSLDTGLQLQSGGSQSHQPLPRVTQRAHEISPSPMHLLTQLILGHLRHGPHQPAKLPPILLIMSAILPKLPNPSRLQTNSKKNPQVRLILLQTMSLVLIFLFLINTSSRLLVK